MSNMNYRNFGIGSAERSCSSEKGMCSGNKTTDEEDDGCDT